MHKQSITSAQAFYKIYSS